MQSCKNCNIKLRTHHENCPLCHGVLTGEFDENDRVFPLVPPKKQTAEKQFMQWVSFGALAIIIVCGLINYMLFDGIWWSAFVTGALLCTWLVLAVATAKRRNLLKSVTWQLVILIALAILWDVFTGWYGWSIDFVLPLAILSALCAVIVIAGIKKMTSCEYMTYVQMVCMAGIAPFVLLVTHTVNVSLPSAICVGACVLTFAAMIIFRRNAFFAEIKKKFHV